MLMGDGAPGERGGGTRTREDRSPVGSQFARRTSDLPPTVEKRNASSKPWTLWDFNISCGRRSMPPVSQSLQVSRPVSETGRERAPFGCPLLRPTSGPQGVAHAPDPYRCRPAEPRSVAAVVECAALSAAASMSSPLAARTRLSGSSGKLRIGVNAHFRRIAARGSTRCQLLTVSLPCASRSRRREVHQTFGG